MGEGEARGGESMKSSKTSLPVQTPPLFMQVLITLKIILFCKIYVLSRSKSLHSMQICMQITVEHLALASKFSLQEKCTPSLSLRDQFFSKQQPRGWGLKTFRHTQKKEIKVYVLCKVNALLIFLLLLKQAANRCPVILSFQFWMPPSVLQSEILFTLPYLWGCITSNWSYQTH